MNSRLYSRWIRSGLGLAAVMLVLSACGGADEGGVMIATTASPAQPQSSTSAEPPDEGPGPGDTEPGDTVPGDTPPAATGAGDEEAPEGELVPDFTLTLGDGSEFSLSAEERPVYMVFWAEWCPTCRGELPKVADISVDYADEVVFLAVAGRGQPDATAERADELFGDRFLWGLGDDIWDLYRVNSQPVTFLVTGDDRVIEQWAGVADEAVIRERLDTLLTSAM